MNISSRSQGSNKVAFLLSSILFVLLHEIPWHLQDKGSQSGWKRKIRELFDSLDKHKLQLNCALEKNLKFY